MKNRIYLVLDERSDQGKSHQYIENLQENNQYIRLYDYTINANNMKLRNLQLQFENELCTYNCTI